MDIERNLIFNLNVIEKCVEKFGKMDDILNATDLGTVKWLAAQMLNEDAEIWNDEHEEKKPLIDEAKLGRYIIGIQGLNELQQKVREAMLLGLSDEQVQEVEEIEKNLMAEPKLNRWMRRRKK